MLERIVSGGQTGVDRAALDVALLLGIDCGGWCPRERKSEDGPIPSRYPLRETEARRYEQRTEWNVRDSDATVIFQDVGPLLGGTERTRNFASFWNRPCLVVRENDGDVATNLLEFLRENDIRCLNVAGPRRSESPRVGEWCREILLKTLPAHTKRNARYELSRYGTERPGWKRRPARPSARPWRRPRKRTN